VDNLVDDLAFTLGVSRDALNIVRIFAVTEQNLTKAPPWGSHSVMLNTDHATGCYGEGTYRGTRKIDNAKWASYSLRHVS
jgi:hypothetical protein